MTREDIIEGNRLIAKFMNKTFLNREEYVKEVHCPKDKILNMPCCNCYYHSDWNWIMKAVDKCFDTPSDYSYHKEIEDALISSDSENRILNVFYTVVNFIKCNNE